jgi:hypothetical protein
VNISINQTIYFALADFLLEAELDGRSTVMSGTFFLVQIDNVPTISQKHATHMKTKHMILPALYVTELDVPVIPKLKEHKIIYKQQYL